MLMPQEILVNARAAFGMNRFKLRGRRISASKALVVHFSLKTWDLVEHRSRVPVRLDVLQFRGGNQAIEGRRSASTTGGYRLSKR